MIKGDLVKRVKYKATTYDGRIKLNSIGVLIGNPEVFGFIERAPVHFACIGDYEWVDTDELEVINEIN